MGAITGEDEITNPGYGIYSDQLGRIDDRRFIPFPDLYIIEEKKESVTIQEGIYNHSVETGG